VVVQKTGWLSPRPEKQAALAPTPQSPAPPLTQVVPEPSGPPVPQAATPTPVAPPSTAMASRTPVAPPTQTKRDSLFFQKLDTNKDGKVTMAETIAWRDGEFDILDINKDGSLSRDELSAGKTRFARKVLQNFDLMDANQDQRLSKEEFRAAGRRRFLMFDANRDNYLNKEEVADMQAR
jgi:hypothetical protein